MKRIPFLVTLLAATLLISGIGWAQKVNPKCLEGIEFFTGLGWGKLREQKTYDLTSFIVDFDLNLKDLTKKLNFNPSSLLQFQIEPFISFVSQPNNNLETGVSFLLKVGILPQDWKFQPFILFGPGMVYMTQHTREQATQFNFIDQVGVGIHYFFRKDIAFTLEGRYRHLSNASIKHPNKGINTQFIVGGISYKF